MPNPVFTLPKKIFTADYPYCIYCGSEYNINSVSLCCGTCAGRLASKDTGGETAGFSYNSCYDYEGPAKELVQRYKYGGQRYLDDKIAFLMRNACEKHSIRADAIVNVPIHKSKKRKRGFDQSERLALKLSELTGIVYIKALKRTLDTVSQTKLTREERIENVKGAFAAVENIEGLDILLIDDVLTTGSTCSECAETLLKSGAKNVKILVFAKAVI